MANLSDDTSLPLLPAPRRIETGEGSLDPCALPVMEILAPDLPGEPNDEYYTLELTPEYAKLSARQPTGLRWARTTLEQLRRLGRVPPLRIEDAPRFAHRGLMLDISRDRVPTFDTLRQLVDRMASWKMNHLQLYVEHTVAYVGHEEVWRDASPLTLEEVSALDAYCAEKGVRLCANQNCLGHFERWLRHPRYAPLGEMDRGHMFRDTFFVLPNTLCPTDPRSLRLVENLLQQLLPRCSGLYANIGCDEPWDLGLGRSRAECEAKGRGRVFSEYVAKVADIARRLGKRPQFWCDPHPNEDGDRLGDIVALIWGYEAETNFETRAAAHRGAGREVWVAPGTSCWNSSTGRTWNRRANLDRAVSTEAAGFLCTAWGDGGHRQPWPITLFGFADAAMAAWSGPGRYDNVAVGLHAFGEPQLGKWLAQLGDADAELCRGERPGFGGGCARPVYNQNALWQELHTPWDRREGPGDASAWEEVAERLEILARTLPSLTDPLLERECRHGLKIARWACERALLRRRLTPVPEDRKKLAARMCELIAEYRTLWLARSRYGGLNDSLQHYIAFTRPY